MGLAAAGRRLLGRVAFCVTPYFAAQAKASGKQGGQMGSRKIRGAARMAMLIDGDNAQPSKIPVILAEALRHGGIAVRRIYGDWTSPGMSGWKASLHAHSIQPMQQFPYTTGKNATDSALIIDAMDLLHSGTVDGFCIVSSDSDFTRLAARIREHGLFVMGIGEPKTPKSFVNACDVFSYTTNLAEDNPNGETPKEAEDWTQLVGRAVIASMRDDGWADLSAVGSQARKFNPSFDPRHHGNRRLSTLIKSKPNVFATREHAVNGQGATAIHVRMLS